MPRRWENTVNSTYAELSRLRNVRVLDWKSVAESMCVNVKCFRDDGYHLTNTGAYLLTSLIYWYGYKDVGNQ